MKKITKYSRHVKITYIKMAALIFLISFFLLPNYHKIEKTGNNVFDVTLNGQPVGRLADEAQAEQLLWEARKQAAQEKKELFFVKPSLEVVASEAYFARFSDTQQVVARMRDVLKSNEIQTRQPAFTIKINQLMVNLSGIEDVTAVLQAALDKYQSKHEFEVSLGPDCDREINVLTAEAKSTEELAQEEQSAQPLEAGVALQLADMLADVTAAKELTFDDFEYGLKKLTYEDKVEIVESYLTSEEISSLEEAIHLVTQEQDQQKIYEVEAGDTLSEIAIKSDIPLDRIIELNENLEDENSMIRIGDELIITSPEPELSIERQEEVYYEEDYEAEIEYVYNDEWYTTDTKLLQQPSAGHRKVAALKTYHNEKETGTEILKEEVTIAAVPKIIEKGTKIPPTYIKPISGGRLSSQYGRRKAPTRGASTFHKGIDWATPVGTAVVASSGGTVARAGWGSGYGYVVYINHADGRQTRYGHLSKVLVKVGQQVSQGDKIALSGNTGRSTGAHLHFEILINGSQVNPLEYMN